MADTPTLELQIRENSEQAIQGLKALAASLNELKTTIGANFGLVKLGNQIEKFTTRMNGAFTPEMAQRVEKVADGLERLSRLSGIKLPKMTGKATLDLLGGKNPLETETVNIGLETQTGTMETVDGLKDRVRGLNDEMGSLGTETGKANEEFGRLGDKMKQVRDSTSGVALGFKDIKKSVDKAISPLDKIINSFGRILFYRVIRNVLKQIGQAFKEGIENVRAYSKAIDGSFNKAMTSMENSLFKMKNSLGAALAPALEAIIPLVQQLVSWFITLVNYVNQFLALLGGKTHWTRATDASASSLDKVKKSAGGAAKEVKNLLAGFDELNIIQSESGGGGGGAGALTPDYTTMFEEVFTFDGRIKEIISWIQRHGPLVEDIVKSIGIGFLAWRISKVLPGDLGEVLRIVAGLYIAFIGLSRTYKAFTDQLKNGVDWDNMSELLGGILITSVGLGLAFGLAGAGVGLLVGGVLLAIAPLKELLETGKLSEVALQQLKIAAIVAGAGITLLATGSLKAAFGMAVAIYGLIEALQDIKDQWDNGVDFENMTSLFRNLAIIVLGAGIAFGTKGMGAAAIAGGLAAIVAPLKELVETGNMSDESFKQLEYGIGLISSGLAILTGNWKMLLIGGIIAGIAWLVKNWENLPTIWEQTVMPWAQRAIADVQEWTGKVWDNFKERHPEIAGALESFAKGIQDFADGVAAFFADPGGTIQGWWDSIVEWWNGVVDANPFLSGVRSVVQDIVGFLTRAWTFIEGVWNDPGQAMVDMLQWLLDLGTQAKESLSKFWMDNVYNSETFGPIVKFVEKAINKIGEILADPGAWLSNMWTGIKGKINDLWDNTIVPYVTKKWNEFLEQPVVKPIADFVRTAADTIKEFVDDPVGYVTNKWTEFTTSLSGKWNEFVEGIKKSARENEFFGPIIEFFENTWPTIVNFINDPIGAIETAWESLKIWFNNNIIVPISNFFIGMANGAIDAINSIIRGLNSISFDLFGQHIGFNIPEIKLIPMVEELEEGGVPVEVDPIVPETIVPESPVTLPVEPTLPEGTDLIRDIFGPDPGVELVFAINEESFEQPVPAPDMSPVVDAVDQARKDVTDDVNEMLRQMERLKTLGFSYDAIFRGGAGGSRFTTYSLFADGGFVGNGDLFMAREAGPELVGRIGSRTAVANNDQIVAGVAGGVAAGQAEQNALLRQQNDLLRQMVAKSGRVEAVPSSDWGRFIQRSSQMYANNTGA